MQCKNYTPHFLLLCGSWENGLKGFFFNVFFKIHRNHKTISTNLTSILDKAMSYWYHRGGKNRGLTFVWDLNTVFKLRAGYLCRGQCIISFQNFSFYNFNRHEPVLMSFAAGFKNKPLCKALSGGSGIVKVII